MLPHALGAEAWRWIGLASATGGAAFLVVALAGGPQGYLHLGWGRYVAYLSRRLRSLHSAVPAARVAAGQLAFAFACASVASFSREPSWLAVAATSLVVPALLLEHRLRKRHAQIEFTADSFCMALANALKSSGSIGAALETAASVMEGPIAQEIGLAIKETRLGRPLGEALEAVGPRTGSVRLATVLAAVLIGRQVGGNLPKVLETTASTLREMERLEGVVRQKTADARMQIWAIGLAPWVICVGIHRLDPEFFAPLTSTPVGYACAGAALLLYGAAVVLARKLMAVDI